MTLDNTSPNPTTPEASSNPAKTETSPAYPQAKTSIFAMLWQNLSIAIVTIITIGMIQILVFTNQFNTKINQSSIELSIRFDSKADHLRQQINDQPQELHASIAFAVRDSNSRIDNTNNRIDHPYQAPVIKP